MAEKPEQKLKTYRARIDALDDQLIALLKERIGVVRQVAALKAEHWPGGCHIRSGREGRMHDRVAKAFSGSDFPVEAALAIWRQIIGASTHVESPLTIAVTENAQSGQARDYFGVTANVQQYPSLAKALAAMNAKRCNILLATAADLPVVRAVAPKLKIFGALPLLAKNDSTLALAEVAPEPSGDDISYYLENGRVTARDGFGEGSNWLGAHPRPIKI